MSKNGEFSICSAYSLIHHKGSALNGGCWKNIWRWQGLEGIKIFFWQVLSNGLLTNYERHRRGLGSPYCTCCNSQMETVMHVPRDCRFAGQVWGKLLNARCRGDFFIWDVIDWILQNLSSKFGRYNDLPWAIL